jgi:hypothetical protein
MPRGDEEAGLQPRLHNAGRIPPLPVGQDSSRLVAQGQSEVQG